MHMDTLTRKERKLVVEATCGWPPLWLPVCAVVGAGLLMLFLAHLHISWVIGKVDWLARDLGRVLAGDVQSGEIGTMLPFILDSSQFQIDGKMFCIHTSMIVFGAAFLAQGYRQYRRITLPALRKLVEWRSANTGADVPSAKGLNIIERWMVRRATQPAVFDPIDGAFIVVLLFCIAFLLFSTYAWVSANRSAHELSAISVTMPVDMVAAEAPEYVGAAICRYELRVFAVETMRMIFMWPFLLSIWVATVPRMVSTRVIRKLLTAHHGLLTPDTAPLPSEQSAP